MSLENGVRLRIESPWKLCKLPKDTPLLLAFSGGADSTALLHLLKEQSLRDGFLLTVAHLNHGIRGEEADRDEEFCRKEAEALGVEFVGKRVSVLELCKTNKKGIEECAREERYAFLTDVMQKKSIPILVTAHHADDQLETVLFRLCRGSGLRGLSGMRKVREFGNGYIVRPFLDISKEKILEYCTSENLRFVTDSSNFKRNASRNKLRLDAVPVLKSLFRNTPERVAEAAGSLAEDEDFIERSAKDFLNEHPELCVEELKALHPALFKRVVLLAFECELQADHFTALVGLIETPREGNSVSLPDRKKAILQNGCLKFIEDDGRNPPTEQEKIPFCEGVTSFAHGKWEINVQKSEENFQVHRNSMYDVLIFHTEHGKISKDLVWRTPEAGDRIFSGGMHRRLKNLFRAAGVPERERKDYPLLCGKDGIFWIPFVAKADDLPASGLIFTVTVRKNDNQKKDTLERNQNHV